MAKISLACDMGTIDIGEIDEHGVVSLMNTIDEPLVPRLMEFLYGINQQSLRVLVDGKCYWTEKWRVNKIAIAITEAQQIASEIVDE